MQRGEGGAVGQCKFDSSVPLLLQRSYQNMNADKE